MRKLLLAGLLLGSYGMLYVIEQGVSAAEGGEQGGGKKRKPTGDAPEKQPEHKKSKGEKRSIPAGYMEIPYFSSKPDAVFPDGEIRNNKLYMRVNTKDPLERGTFKEALEENK